MGFELQLTVINRGTRNYWKPHLKRSMARYVRSKFNSVVEKSHAFLVAMAEVAQW